MPADGCLVIWMLCPVADDMTYWERLEALGGNTYDYDAGVDSQPGPFDYDDLRDYEEWCDWNDVDVEEGYYEPFQSDVEERVVPPGDAFGMDTDAVVVASVVCEAKNTNLGVAGLCGDIGSGPGTHFPEPGDMLDVLDFC